MRVRLLWHVRVPPHCAPTNPGLLSPPCSAPPVRAAWVTADASDEEFEFVEGIRIYHGTPSPDAGHVVKVTSYFDRFWEHGQHTERYFMVLDKKL